MNITLNGMTFAYTRNTYMEPFEVPSGGDWALHRWELAGEVSGRGGVVFVDGAENIHVQ